ncbi:hypothetical protein MUU74_02645 [Chryseobacterium daecheongense]|uniref:hypothetical protein n=1 Tax=Chryseobacterium daecheongense TaxID=192389 RepID=UPI001FD6816F|nr:hypothetical protein [Chryseobacterium daecheongense]UOU98857.1 hypothetical protein MUU74_02645 [Chryseobacterium daecheongense]
MKNALFKTFLFFVLLFFSNFGCQEKVDRMDSLIIEANPDPGRSLGNFFIKIYFSKKHFKVKYEFYEGFDRMGFYQNSKVQEILKKYEGNITDGNRELFRKDTEKIRTQYEKYYKRQIILKNKVYKNYLSQVYNVSNITDEVIESEKKRK